MGDGAMKRYLRSCKGFKRSPEIMVGPQKTIGYHNGLFGPFYRRQPGQMFQYAADIGAAG